MKLKESLRGFEKFFIILAGSAGLTAVLLNFDFDLVEARLYDTRMIIGGHARADSEIVLVALDQAATKELDESSPLPLEFHTQFVEALEKLEPKAAGYLIDFNHVNQVNPEQFSTEWAQRFVDAVMRMRAKGTTVILGTPYDVTGEVLPPYPLSTLPHSLAVIHKDGNVFAEDKVIRRALVALNDQPSFHLQLARALGYTAPDSYPRGTYYLPEVDGKFFFFRYHGKTAIEGGKLDSLPYASYSFLDIIKNKLPAGALRGKTVLIDTMSKENWSDFVYTPYSRAAFTNPELVVHASILDSVIHNQGIVLAPDWLNWLTTFAVTAFVLSWVMNSSPLGGVFSTVGLALVFALFAQLLFQLKGFWLRESQPLIGIFLAYYLTVPYRLMREYQKRWDYQRKNELLMQVEELKTNFLSLVTHDLKTPVARIQGLAEVLLRKSAERLAPRDEETIRNIIGSTEELNRFISSILELSKVESKRLQIRFESKDINQLIERSVDGFRASARARGITIQANLEPLFPIKMDASLISKVINTLLDNALKYSLPGSEITVNSAEVGDWIEVSVKDQGIGMTPEEQENLFTRFYRAKNDTTTQIPGTGLGLYLTKYFVEAHQGRVEVQSRKDEGSTFKIFLPILATAQKPAVAQVKGLGFIKLFRKSEKKEKTYA